MKRRSKKYETLLSAEFSGATDCWTEYLCIERHRNGGITLSSRGHEVIDEAYKYNDEDGNEDFSPLIDDGYTGLEIGGDYVLGEELVLQDDYATVTVERGVTRKWAKSWLEERGWNKKKGYAQAWERIEAMLK